MRRFLGVFIAALAALAVTASLAVAPPNMGVASSAPTIAGDGTGSTTMTASAPAVNASITGESVISRFDPAALQLTSGSGITAPAGWTLSYSADGSTFGAAPGTPSGWAAVQAVKATGPLVSSGASGSLQQVTNQSVASEPGGGAINGANSSGDGWDVFFDADHVFNVWHHDGNNNVSQGAIDCHKRDGTSCGPGWPFFLTSDGTASGTSVFHTDVRSTGWVDTANHHLWIPTNSTSASGFACVNIADFTTGPTWCGGSTTAALRAVGVSVPTSHGGSGYCAPANSNFIGGCLNEFAEVNGKLFAWDSWTGKLVCLDTAASGGAGSACAGQPYSFAGIGNAGGVFNSDVAKRRSGLIASGGLIYGVGTATTSSSGSFGICFDPSTLAACTGWSSPKTLASLQPMIYEQTDSYGTVQGVCFRAWSSGNFSSSCFTPAGVAFGSGGAPTLNTTLSNALIIAGRGYGWLVAKSPVRVGTKIFWGNASWEAGNAGGSASRLLNCFDTATNAACTNWPKTSVLNYAMSVDPYNDGCVWKNDNDGHIGAYNIATGASSCPPPPTVSFRMAAITPRLSCASGGVSSWQQISLSGTTYTSATLTVRDAAGAVVTSGGTPWQNVPFVAGAVDLSTLAVADSGINGTFEVTFVGRDNTPATGSVSALGGTPELCLPLQAQIACPTAPAQVPPGPMPTPSPAVLTSDGEATLASSGTQTFTTASISVPRTPGTAAQCLGDIAGQTTIQGTATPVPNVTMTLVDGSGNPIATTTTDASGNYSFGRLAAGNGYKVQFGSGAGVSITAPTSSSGANPRTVVVAQTTIVNGEYVLAVASSPSASPDTTSGPQGKPQSIDLLGNDTPSSGATLTPSTVRICGPLEVSPSCTQTTVTVPGVGTYALSGGTITFTPLPAYTGTPAPLPYIVQDSSGQTAASTYTPTVPGPSAAAAGAGASPKLAIRTTASRPVLKPGQQTTITLVVRNRGTATATRTVTRAPIPAGFAIVRPNGGKVVGGVIRFQTGNIAPNGRITRTYVLVATRAGVGKTVPVMGRATATNTRPVKDPTALRVIGTTPVGGAAVTG